MCFFLFIKFQFAREYWGINVWMSKVKFIMVRKAFYYSWKRMDWRCHMSQEILNSVLAIESEAKRWREKFDEKLSQTKAATDQRVNEAKSNMEQFVRSLSSWVERKNQQKKAEFEAKVKEDELAEIACAERTFQSSETGFSSGYCEGGVEEIWQ